MRNAATMPESFAAAILDAMARVIWNLSGTEELTQSRSAFLPLPW
jgi:hypothetical protein